MCVLAILSHGKSYGYEIMKELEKHRLKLKGVGSIYPILSKLKDQGWVTDTRELSESGKARVYYEITPSGDLFLDKKIQEWQESATGYSIIAFIECATNGRWRGTGEPEIMTLSYEEEQFIADVRRELIRYEMTSNQVEAVVEQIREHLEASREHGEYGLEDLGSPDTYVRDYAEVQGLVRVQDAMDLESVPEEPPGQRAGGWVYGTF